MKGFITAGRVSGTWYLRIEHPRAADGTRKRKRHTFTGTKKDAERKLRDLLREVETGVASLESLSTSEVTKRWLETVKHRVGARTYASYDAHVRLYIVPAIGNLKIDALRPAHVEKALASWATIARNDREKGTLSQRTVAHIFNTLRSICRWAVKMSLLARNPIDAVDSPRVDRREMRALSIEGIAELVAVTRGTELEDPIAVALGTGLRRGELLALRWSDVDLANGRMSVRRSLETVDGVTRTKPPKTTRSARTISLPQSIVATLQRRRIAQIENRLMFGLGREEDGWVFTRADESQWPPGVFSHVFARHVKRTKIRHIRFHDLRHSFGTNALAAGVDLKTVSTALGHSAISTTANVYLHAVESLERDAAARIESLIGGALATPARPAAASPAKRSGPQRAHAKAVAIEKARGYGQNLVAPTGVEPVSQP